MDICQDTLYDQPVRESDRTDAHNIGGNGLPEPRLPTSMSFRVFLRHLLSLSTHQFCTAYELFIPCFVILTGESIRRECQVTLQNIYLFDG